MKVNNIKITDITDDSRKVKAGGAFFATSVGSDRHEFIPAAIEAGAKVIVGTAQGLAPFKVQGSRFNEVTFIEVDNVNRAFGEASAELYDYPSRKLKLVGVTGTNGKTTIATLLYELFRAAGYKCGLISTIVNRIDRTEVATLNTTPNALELNELLAAMVDEGCDYCFMEVSSHGVAQERIAGQTFAGGIFTNLTHDHLDFHKTFAAYRDAKQEFFTRLGNGAFAITNADDRNGTIMVQNSSSRKRTYALHKMADYHCRILEESLEGMLLELDGEQVWVQLVGEFNAYNLTAIYAAARELGLEKIETLKLLSSLRPVRGRFETMNVGGVTAIVDYAHTPDALRNVMDTINDLRNGKGRLIVVVGCGGDRDKTKRPEMAHIAVEGADFAIFTSDNPRTENPQSILDDMTAGVTTMPKSRYMTITDRGEAIGGAMRMAMKGDVVLVAGKGHETYQIIGDKKYHFDDREIILNFENKII